MRFSSPLIPARFWRRQQRFLAETELADGSRVWAHVPNTGALRGCATPGQEILLTADSRPGRKTGYTWRFTRGPQGWICIDTLVPNRVIAEALAGPGLRGIPRPEKIRREVAMPEGSRLDFVLELRSGLLFMEVKSVTWVEGGVALFPDGITARGRKHLAHLAARAAEGHEVWQVFVVQRQDATVLRPAAEIDPAYARDLARVAHRGVKILVVPENVNPPEITLASPLPFDL